MSSVWSGSKLGKGAQSTAGSDVTVVAVPSSTFMGPESPYTLLWEESIPLFSTA